MLAKAERLLDGDVSERADFAGHRAETVACCDAWPFPLQSL